jgi:hypothetical protein
MGFVLPVGSHQCPGCTNFGNYELDDWGWPPEIDFQESYWSDTFTPGLTDHPPRGGQYRRERSTDTPTCPRVSTPTRYMGAQRRSGGTSTAP